MSSGGGSLPPFQHHQQQTNASSFPHNPLLMKAPGGGGGGGGGGGPPGGGGGGMMMMGGPGGGMMPPPMMMQGGGGGGGIGGGQFPPNPMLMMPPGGGGGAGNRGGGGGGPPGVAGPPMMMPLMNPAMLMRPINLNQHPTGLPPNLLVMFKARPPVKWFPPAKARKTCKRLTGVGKYLDLFDENDAEKKEPTTRGAEDGKGHDDYDSSDVDVNDDGEIIEIDEETKRKKREEKEKFALLPEKTKKKLEKGKKMLKEALKAWDPQKDEKATGDPYATLFVARLPFSACEDEDILRREFERYGDIKSVRIVRDIDTGKPTGYAFIEFETEDDMKRAFTRANGTRIEGKRVIVDAERGRTTPNWRPMRLGGGLGGYAKQPSKKEIRMREMGNQRRGGGGGGGGGFRGGGPGGGGGRGGRSGFGDDRTCHVCGQTGHFARECPERREMNNRGRGRFDGGRGGDDMRDRGDLPPPPSRGDRGGIGFSGRDDYRERSPGLAPRFGTGMMMDEDRDRGGDRFGRGGRDDRRPTRYSDDFDRDRRDRKRGRSRSRSRSRSPARRRSRYDDDYDRERGPDRRRYDRRDDDNYYGRGDRGRDRDRDRRGGYGRSRSPSPNYRDFVDEPPPPPRRRGGRSPSPAPAPPQKESSEEGELGELPSSSPDKRSSKRGRRSPTPEKDFGEPTRRSSRR